MKKVAEEEKKLIAPGEEQEEEGGKDHHHHSMVEVDDTLKPPNKVNIWISCKHLPNLEVFSKTDPFVNVYIKEEKRTTWVLIGQTEEIPDELDPNFKTMIGVNYYFEK